MAVVSGPRLRRQCSKSYGCEPRKIILRPLAPFLQATALSPVKAVIKAASQKEQRPGTYLITGEQGFLAHPTATGETSVGNGHRLRRQ
jgi:hypothetical protein